MKRSASAVRKACVGQVDPKSPVQLFITSTDAKDVPEPLASTSGYGERVLKVVERKGEAPESAVRRADGPRRPTRPVLYEGKSRIVTSAPSSESKKSRDQATQWENVECSSVLNTRNQGVQTADPDWERISDDATYLSRICSLMNQFKSPEELYEIGRRECPDMESRLLRGIIRAHFPMRHDEAPRYLGAGIKPVLISGGVVEHSSTGDPEVKEDEARGASGSRAAAPAEDCATVESPRQVNIQEDLHLSDSDESSVVIVYTSSDDE